MTRTAPVSRMISNHITTVMQTSLFTVHENETIRHKIRHITYTYFINIIDRALEFASSSSCVSKCSLCPIDVYVFTCFVLKCPLPFPRYKNDVRFVFSPICLVEVHICIYYKQCKQWWPPILPMSTKRTITSHLIWTHWTQKDYEIWGWKSRSWLGAGRWD